MADSESGIGADDSPFEITILTASDTDRTPETWGAELIFNTVEEAGAFLKEHFPESQEKGT